jgi:hypothetical protein
MPTPVLLLVLACAGLASASQAEARPQGGPFVDVSSWLVDEADYEAWYLLRRGLRENFDAICGDGFCEGDYTNIQLLGFQCSVGEASGRIGQCAWSFAGSLESIGRHTGRVGWEPMAWTCIAPLAPGTAMADLLSALAGDSPLYASLPGTSTTLYDGLIGCL